MNAQIELILDPRSALITLSPFSQSQIFKNIGIYWSCKGLPQYLTYQGIYRSQLKLKKSRAATTHPVMTLTVVNRVVMMGLSGTKSSGSGFRKRATDRRWPTKRRSRRRCRRRRVLASRSVTTGKPISWQSSENLTSRKEFK